jgi:hypothetical protein
MESSSTEVSASSRVFEAVIDLQSTHDRLREICSLLLRMGYRPVRASMRENASGIATGRRSRA